MFHNHQYYVGVFFDTKKPFIPPTIIILPIELYHGSLSVSLHEYTNYLVRTQSAEHNKLKTTPSRFGYKAGNNYLALKDTRVNLPIRIAISISTTGI